MPEVSLHAPAHGLAELLDLRRGGAALVDQEVAVQLGNLRRADGEAAQAGLVDELPGFVAGRILEGRAAGAALDRLRRLAPLGDLVHGARDLGRIAGLALKQRLGEDQILRRAAMAVGVVHVGIRQHVQRSPPVDRARLDENVLGLAAIGSTVHAQRAADRAGYTSQKG